MAEAAAISILVVAVDDATPKLNAVTAATERVGGSASGLSRLGGAVSGIVGTLGQIGLANFGIDAIAHSFEQLTGAALEHQNVMAQTEAVLRSTGGAAGFSAEEITKTAEAFSLVTPYEDEAIQSAENILLTFTRIGGEIMPQATEAILNTATALGQPLHNTAIQVGKALNDPVQGMQALRRVGVQLTSDQQTLIKTMVETGNTAGAQAVILRELQTEFGGSARAAGETFTGKLAILHTQLDNLKEAAFMPLLGVASAVVVGLTTVALAIQAAFGIVPAIVGAATAAFEEHRFAFIAMGAAALGFLIPSLLAAAVAFGTVALSAVIAAADMIAAWAAAALPFVAVVAVIGIAAVTLEGIWRTNFGGIQQVTSAALGFVQDRIADFLDFIAGVLGRFGVEFNWREMLSRATEGTEAVLGTVGEVASGGIDKLKELLTVKGYDSGKALGEAIDDGAESSEGVALKKLMVDAQRVSEVIQQQSTVLQRENLELKQQEAAAQLQLLPLKSEEADLALQLNESAQKRTEIELQTVAAKEKLLGLTASQASEDLSYEQKRLQLKIQADALAGRGVAAEDVNKLVALAKQKPEVELRALEAGRPQTLAERQLAEFQLNRQLNQAPIQERQADLALEVARRQREIDAINAAKQAQTLSNVPQLADLEARKRALEDAQFIAKQQLADMNKGKGAGDLHLNITQNINANGEIDYDRVIESTFNGVLDGLTQAQKAGQNTAGNFAPGARLPFGGPY